jgi:hypothetical protein
MATVSAGGAVPAPVLRTHAAMSPARRAHDADATCLDLRPWHQESGAFEIDDAPPRGRATSAIFPTEHRPRRLVSEPLENLTLPPDLHDAMLPAGTQSRTLPQLRIAIVRLARELAREYRGAFGRLLRTDPASIEVMQRRLLAHAEGVLRGAEDPRSLLPMIGRHGVVLGEIFARTLEGEWTRLAGDDPGTWCVRVASGAEVYPVALVHAFVLERSRAKDLVGSFLDLAW